MQKTSVLCVVGTRPEAIKMAPVIKELRKHQEHIDTEVCITAQHREMLDQILGFFRIKPDYDLDVMEERQSLGRLTANIMNKIEPLFAELKPDWILVQGDTTTVMVAALAGYYQRIRIGHVEAGLRSRNKFHPFPEEVNRQMVDLLSDLHFAPTTRAKSNLLQEGIHGDSIFVTGNTVIDALFDVLGADYDWNSGPLSHVPENRRLILVTAHRRENYGQPITEICRALKEIAARYHGDVHVVYPVHLNPSISDPVYSLLGGISNVTLVPPVDYPDLVNLMKRCYLVLTDSGGIQEEAPSLGKPVLVLRRVTERPEAVDAGTVKVVGTDAETIVSETSRLLEDQDEYQRMATAINPYGDGLASSRIVQILLGKRPQEFQ